MNMNGTPQQTDADAAGAAATVEPGAAPFTDIPASVLLSALPQSVLVRMAQPLLQKLLSLDSHTQLAVAEAIETALGAAAETGAEQITIDDALGAILRGIFSGFGEQAPLADDGNDIVPAVFSAIESAIRQVLQLPADPDGEPVDAPDAGGLGDAVQFSAQLLDLSQLNLEQLMDLDVRGNGLSIFEPFGETPAPRGPTPAGLGPDDDLPPDLTAFGLQQLMNLNVLLSGFGEFDDDLPDDLTGLSLATLMTIPLSGGGSVVNELPTQIALLAQGDTGAGADAPVISGASFAPLDLGTPVNGLSPALNAQGAGNAQGQGNGNGQGNNANGQGNGNNAVNNAPTTNAAAAGGSEDAASIAVVLSGADIDGTVQSFALSTLPANGTLYTDAGLTTVAATGVDYAATAEALTLYFVPTGGWNGVTTFDFAAKNDGGLADATPATASHHRQRRQRRSGSGDRRRGDRGGYCRHHHGDGQ